MLFRLQKKKFFVFNLPELILIWKSAKTLVKMVTWSESDDVIISLITSSNKFFHKNLGNGLVNTCAKFHISTTKDSQILTGSEIRPRLCGAPKMPALIELRRSYFQNSCQQLLPIVTVSLQFLCAIYLTKTGQKPWDLQTQLPKL